MHPQSPTRYLKKLSDHCGLPDLRPHKLRHTFATQTLNAGVPITVVSKWLGHANVSVTYNTYIHVLESVETTAVTLLEAI